MIKYSCCDRCLNYCNLIEFGRDRAYFDFNRLYTIGNHLKIAHGYKISMDRYDNRVLLCTEVAHKLMKDDTVLDLIEKLNRNANGDIAVWKEQCFRNLVGQTVITRYTKINFLSFFSPHFCCFIGYYIHLMTSYIYLIQFNLNNKKLQQQDVSHRRH